MFANLLKSLVKNFHLVRTLVPFCIIVIIFLIITFNREARNYLKVSASNSIRNIKNTQISKIIKNFPSFKRFLFFPFFKFFKILYN